MILNISIIYVMCLAAAIIATVLAVRTDTVKCTSLATWTRLMASPDGMYIPDLSSLHILQIVDVSSFYRGCLL